MIYQPLPIGRVCRECGIWKPRYLLRKNKKQTDGVEKFCLDCSHRQGREYYARNAENVKARAREEYANFPERVKERNKRSREKPEQKQKAIKRVKQWQKTNPEKVKRIKKVWRDTHPLNMQLGRQRHLARKAKTVIAFTKADWLLCLEYFNYCCAYCGHQQGFFPGMNLTQDHFIPVEKHGNYTPDNIVPACQSCNTSKLNRDPVEWLNKRLKPTEAKATLKRIQDYFEWVKSQD